jgi:hypothetical protein
MGKAPDSARLIHHPLLFLGLIIGILISSPFKAYAQHEIAPETWIEMSTKERHR